MKFGTYIALSTLLVSLTAAAPIPGSKNSGSSSSFGSSSRPSVRSPSRSGSGSSSGSGFGSSTSGKTGFSSGSSGSSGSSAGKTGQQLRTSGSVSSDSKRQTGQRTNRNSSKSSGAGVSVNTLNRKPKGGAIEQGRRPVFVQNSGAVYARPGPSIDIDIETSEGSKGTYYHLPTAGSDDHHYDHESGDDHEHDTGDGIAKPLLIRPNDAFSCGVSGLDNDGVYIKLPWENIGEALGTAGSPYGLRYSNCGREVDIWYKGRLAPAYVIGYDKALEHDREIAISRGVYHRLGIKGGDEVYKTLDHVKWVLHEH